MKNTSTKRKDVERLVTVENKLDSLSQQVKNIDYKFDTFINRVDNELADKADKNEVKELKRKHNDLKIRISYFSGAVAILGFLAIVIVQFL